jgi:acyl carrier protein
VSETLAALNRLMAARLGSRAALAPDTELVADLGLDSLQQLELVVELENHFAVSLEVEGADEIRTVGDLIAHIERARGAQR